MSRKSLIRRALAATAAAATISAGMALLAPAASAAPQTETITFDDPTPGPVSDVLANQVAFSIDQGNGIGTEWNLPNHVGPTTVSFDRPVDVRFGIDGLNAPGEDVQLPAGTVLEDLHPNHSWDEDTLVVRRQSGSCSIGCVSTFTLDNTTVLTAEPLSALTWVRQIDFIEVTYNLPVTTINGPSNGGVYTEGDGTVLDFTCEDGTGAIVSGATIDGEPIENGDSVTSVGPGIHTVEVACVDEHGAIHVSTVTFEVEAAPVPVCLEDGMQVFDEPYLAFGPGPDGFSDGIHGYIEPPVESLDPLVTDLGLPALQPIVHSVNCDLIVPVEDVLDEVLIPVVVEVKKLLGLFG